MDKVLIKLVRRYDNYHKYQVYFEVDEDENSLLYRIMNTLTYEEFMQYYWINKYCFLAQREENKRKIMNMATHKEVMNILKICPSLIRYKDKPNKRQVHYALSRNAMTASYIKPEDMPPQSIIGAYMRSQKNRSIWNPLTSMKQAPIWVENYIIDKGIIDNITRYTIENQKRAVAKDFRYLLDFDAHYDGTHERLEELLEYAIEHGQNIIKSLCEESVLYFRPGHFFRTNKRFSQGLLKKCVERYPMSINYFYRKVVSKNLNSNEYDYDYELIEYAIGLDGRAIECVSNPSYELCQKAIQSNPQSIINICQKKKYTNKKLSIQDQKELKFLKHLALELCPELVQYPLIRSKETIQLSLLFIHRRSLQKMLDLCIILHQLELPDLLLYEIFDHLHPEHNIPQIELWHVTRIAKGQELRIKRNNPII